MRCEDFSERVADYLTGSLAEPERASLQRHLDACAACRSETQGLAETWKQLDEIPGARSDSSVMRARFDAFMRTYRQGPDRAGASGNIVNLQPRRSWRSHPLLQACAATVLLAAGFLLGREMRFRPAAPSSPDVMTLRAEVSDLRQMVTLSLMQQQSASERLRGVSFSSQLDQPGNKVVSALINTLMHDANVNVRLASIDALKRFAERDIVRAATIHALDTQTSPLVQMALIDFVVETQERGAIDALRRLSRDDMVNEAVRARAVWGIKHLGAA